MRYEHNERPALLLDDEASVTSVSEECRAAGLAFVNGFRETWDKLDLVIWLTGPYAQAARHTTRSGLSAPAFAPSDVAFEPVVEIVEHVRAATVEALSTATYREGGLPFLDANVRRGLVQKTLDEDGVAVWVPVARAGLRLSDRVESLFAADFLNAPDAYQELFVCRTCGAVGFDAVSRRLRQCAAHAPAGGVHEPAAVERSRPRPGLARARLWASPRAFESSAI